ncbi:nuclease harbi1-like protein [Plakobranchus ocellatus]|uniref:Nuclease harbi1-like protein n=1 Tax=Plakobranchus ocellatus TaxID=259542 RepID=A0AAV4AGA1_9GAST|nr:nuclease harbi1-like protein [Plakobranchus ocellatus]
MKPFPRRNLTFEQRVFNYRLSRARRQVECSFGVLSNTWRILLKSIEKNTVTAIEYVKAVCVLHNFLLAHEPERMKTPDSQYECSSMDRDDIVFASTRTASQAANATRNKLRDYFVSPTGSLPWQNEACLNNT